MSMSWLYDVFAKNWGRWVKQSEATIKRGAFYSTLVKPGFRIISLNTNFCNNINWWLMMNMTDPEGELQWLVEQLSAAERDEEVVHIIGHIPPGVVDCLPGWSANYHRIIHRFESTVRAQFFGHVHIDSVEVFYSESHRPVSVAYLSPSVTPYDRLNPGYRVYQVDGDRPGTTRLVVDHETHIANLTEANKAGHSLDWRLEYTAMNAYGMRSLVPAEWDNLIRRMLTDDRLWNRYYKYYFKSRPQLETCGMKCRHRMLCEMVTARSYDNTCEHLNLHRPPAGRRGM